MIRAYKYRLYPTEEQKAYFAKAFGCCRYAYNYYVREHERIYKDTGKTATSFDLIALMQAHKQNIPWLNEADSAMLSWTAMRVTNGWRSFFDRVNSKPPHEHQKGERKHLSYTTRGHLKVYFRQNLIAIPLVGNVRAVLHRRFYGQIKNITISQTASGAYYASLCVDTRLGQVAMKPFDKDKAVGIDVGVRHFLTLSTGEHIEMPDISKHEHRRAFLQRRLKSQKKDSKGYKKTARQIARISEHISNIRMDFHQKTAAQLCDKYSAISMETLCVKGMRQGVNKEKSPQNNGFNRSLQHVGLGQFSCILEQKAAHTGTHFTRIDRWEPTTKRCHVCGYTNNDITLSTENWTCPECGTFHDRDVNAAINIKNLATEQQPPATVEEAPLNDDIIKKQLPLVERKVKSAKGCRISAGTRRTEKVTGHETLWPSTQIEDGTTRPRLATMPAPFNYVRLHPFAREAGVPAALIASWLSNGVPGNERTDFFTFLDRLKILADECRIMKILYIDRSAVSAALLKMNRFIDMSTFSEETFHHGKTFTWWRNLRKSREEIHIINKFYTETIPSIIEEYVERYRTLLL